MLQLLQSVIQSKTVICSDSVPSMFGLSIIVAILTISLKSQQRYVFSIDEFDDQWIRN